MYMTVSCASRIPECLLCSAARAIHGLDHADFRICHNQCITYAQRSLYYIICYRIYFPFHKPAAQAAAGHRSSPFKEEIALLSADPDGIAVSLAAGLLRRGRADIGHLIDFVFLFRLPR